MKPQQSLRKSAAKAPADQVVKDIRRVTRRHFSAEDSAGDGWSGGSSQSRARIVLDGLRGEDSIAELCRKEGMASANVTATASQTPASFHRRKRR